jgi:hypothetical protein
LDHGHPVGGRGDELRDVAFAGIEPLAPGQDPEKVVGGVVNLLVAGFEPADTLVGLARRIVVREVFLIVPRPDGNVPSSTDRRVLYRAGALIGCSRITRPVAAHGSEGIGALERLAVQ